MNPIAIWEKNTGTKSRTVVVAKTQTPGSLGFRYWRCCAIVSVYEIASTPWARALPSHRRLSGRRHAAPGVET